MLGTWYQGEKTSELGDKPTEVTQQVLAFSIDPSGNQTR